MEKRSLYTITENAPLAQDVFRLRLAGDGGWVQRPGQFVNIALAGKYLRRPISVCDWTADSLTLIYKVVGSGTAQMAAMKAGETLDILTGLGNGFAVQPALGKNILLAGGGVGVPPLYGLARLLRRQGERVQCVLGFRSACDVFYEEEFSALGCETHVVTNDGSRGAAGFVTDVMKTLDYDYYFACGPQPMLKAVHGAGKRGQLSFEERMGCGFGACMGCSCQTLAGNKRICVDGPVLLSEEVRFDG